MHINRNDLVLEIGSGDRPFPRSDILCDRFLASTNHRLAQSHIVIDRPFVVADAEALPFRDKSVDYVIASHLLEHLDHPDKFLAEIERVGKRGYLAFPAPLAERLFANKSHRWYCNLIAKKITLIKKTSARRDHLTLNKKQLIYQKLLENQEVTSFELEWSNTIASCIYQREPKLFIEKLDKKIATYSQTNLRPGYLTDKYQRAKDNLYNGLCGGACAANAWCIAVCVGLT